MFSKKNYNFPVINSHCRSFRFEWLDKYQWLAYSHKRKEAFCKVCVLFEPKVGGVGGQKLGVLKETSLIKYNDALNDFKKHSEREYHKTAIVQSYEFIKCFEGKQTIEIQHNDKLKKKNYRKQKKLIHIIKTIIFCGRYNIPLQGHHDEVNLKSLIPIDDTTNAHEVQIINNQNI